MALLVKSPADLRNAYVWGQIIQAWWDPSGKVIAAVQVNETVFQLWSVTP